MVRSAALLFRERGVHGTSFADVLEHSGAPRGSIYHHFRGGKRELAVEATEWAGEVILAGTVRALRDHDPVSAIGALTDQWLAILRGSNYAAGCVIVAAALEGDREPLLRDTAGRVFGAWESALATALRDAGADDARAASIGTLIVAALEGAIVLARAQRSTVPLERVTDELQLLVASALPTAAQPRSRSKT